MRLAEKTDDEINQAALNHVANVWRDSTLLNGDYSVLKPKDGQTYYETEKGLFRFEMKCFTDLVVLHGSSNYSFNPLDADKTKMRSYESKREHLGFTLENDELSTTDHYETLNPAQCLLLEIQNNPTCVKRLPPFIKTAILKPAAFANDYRNKWSKTLFRVGDNIIKTGKPNYFSLSAFTYKTREQYQAWKKTYEKLKRKNGESFEMFFTNDDDTINYQQMLLDIDAAIRNGVINPIAHFDKNRHRNRLESPAAKTYHEAEKQLKTVVKDIFITEDDDMPFIDDSDYE